jgi:hypothetical protein
LTPNVSFYFVTLAVSFVGLVGILVLQLGALIRYRHVSFSILSLATTSGLVGFFFWVIPFWWVPFGASPVTLEVLSGTFVILQWVLGLWGTFRLFRSYGELASAKGGTRGADRGA